MAQCDPSTPILKEEGDLERPLAVRLLLGFVNLFLNLNHKT